ncbi:MAG: DUF2946 domain-containing protein [Noviherbaspirillum sp.]
MGMNRHCRCIAAWMACFAVLLAALAPTVSHAVNAARLADTGQHEYCSAGSAEAHGGHAQASGHADHSTPAALPGSAPYAGHGPDGGLHFEHCPFCLTHAGSFGLAPGFSITVQPEIGVALRPGLFYHSPQPLFAWTGAQPRAPPAVS